jgi:hypothetical protein
MADLQTLHQLFEDALRDVSDAERQISSHRNRAIEPHRAARSRRKASGRTRTRGDHSKADSNLRASASTNRERDTTANRRGRNRVPARSPVQGRAPELHCDGRTRDATSA